MLCAFWWAIPRPLNFICRRFGTLSVSEHCLFRNTVCFGTLSVPEHCLFRNTVCFGTLSVPEHCQFRLWRWKRHTQCSKSLEYKIKTPRNYPVESINHSINWFAISANSGMGKELVRKRSGLAVTTNWQHFCRFTYSASWLQQKPVLSSLHEIITLTAVTHYYTNSSNTFIP